MEFQKFDVKLRQASGKGPSRRMRAAGLAPAVVYGKGIETFQITVSPKGLKEALAGPLRTNTVLNLAIEGASKDVPKEILAIVRDHQYDPITRDLLHVDFAAVDQNTPVTVKVPVKPTGKSVGEKIGGIVQLNFREMPISCLPAAIPAVLEIDISSLLLNDSVSVAELSLPEGVSVLLPPTATALAIVPTRAVDDDKPAAADGEEVAVVGAKAADKKDD